MSAPRYHPTTQRRQHQQTARTLAATLAFASVLSLTLPFQLLADSASSRRETLEATLVNVPSPTKQTCSIYVEGVEIWLTPPIKPVGVPESVAQAGFVRRSNQQLVLKDDKGHDSPFYFMGFNAYWLPDKRLGLKVGRTWAFNSDLPKTPGVYDDQQFQSLDFAIYVAGQYDIRMILALGNLWPAYFSPERWLSYAKGSTADLNILDFYKDEATKDLLKQHITVMANRVNVFTGVKYKDDPAIMAWDVLNEPRCPGCQDPVNQGHVHTWMKEMMAHLRSEDPNHLITLGTEGFFMPDRKDFLHMYNPGAGAQCEGEDWRAIAQLDDLDVSTLHVYRRHMENIPEIPVGRSYLGDPDWLYCTFECYINWMVQYIQIHLEVNVRDVHKPIILEEFGLTWWISESADLKVVIEVVRQLMVHSQSSNGALAGAMFWTANHNDSFDEDGYGIKIDRYPSSLNSTGPQIAYPMNKILGTYRPVLTEYDLPGADQLFIDAQPVESGSDGENLGNASIGGVPAADVLAPAATPAPGTVSSFSAGPDKPILSTSDTSGAAPRSMAPSSIQPPSSAPGLDEDFEDDNGPATPSVTASSSPKTGATSGVGAKRALLVQEEGLDGFRRGSQRAECASNASATWRPTPYNKSIVNVTALRNYTVGLTPVDLLAQAAQQLHTGKHKRMD